MLRSSICLWNGRIFIIEGALTFCVAIIVFFVIPDYPHTAKKLKPIDRVLAQLRLDEDAGTTPSTKEPSMKEGFMMAVKDYRTWCIGTLQFCITNMIGFNFFYPTLIEGLGYTNNITILLLSAPPYIAALIFSFCECRRLSGPCLTTFPILARFQVGRGHVLVLFLYSC